MRIAESRDRDKGQKASRRTKDYKLYHFTRLVTSWTRISSAKVGYNRMFTSANFVHYYEVMLIYRNITLTAEKSA